MSRLEIVAEIWQFMRERKRYWILPIFIVLVLFGLLLILAETSPVAPFIYTLF